MDLNDVLLHYHADDWMNDPILFFNENEYHVFFQYKWPRQWGHIKSTDMIHWEELPVALLPDKEGPDAEGGCFTGCCIRDGEQFHLFYTGSGKAGEQTTCHAMSDDLITWVKDPLNPVLKPAAPYQNTPGAPWRDPHVWREDGFWYMAQCAAVMEETRKPSACIGLMRSRDLTRWEMLPPLYQSDGMMMYECPDLFPLEGKYLLLFSCFRTFAAIADNSFGPFRLNPGLSYLDHDLYYAAKTLLDDRNRRLAWGFIFEGCGWEYYHPGQVWAPTLEGRTWWNCLAFPRQLGLNQKGELICSWPEEMQLLRKKPLLYHLTPRHGFWEEADEMIAGKPARDYAFSILEDIHGTQLEIRVRIRLTTAKKAGVVVRCSGDGGEMTGISINRQTNSVHIEDLSAGFEAPHSRIWDNFSQKPSFPVSLPLPEGTDDAVELRIIVDGSMIEVEINQVTILTGRCYTKKDDAFIVGLFTVSGEAEFQGLCAWELGV